MTNDIIIELADGTGTAVIRPPDAVPERKRRAIMEVAARGSEFQAEFAMIQEMIAAGNGANVSLPNQGAMFGLLSELGTALIVGFVRSWPYGDVTPDVLLDEVPGGVFDQLKAIVFPMFPELVKSFTVDGAMSVGADGQPVRDPQSPTPPSAG